MAKRRSSGDDEGGYSWMDTYGDMVTLLLCFFVLLFAFSSVNEDKWRALVLSFTGSMPKTKLTAMDMLSEPDFQSAMPGTGVFPLTSLQGNSEVFESNGDAGEMQEGATGVPVLDPSVVEDIEPVKQEDLPLTDDMKMLMSSAEYQAIERDFSELYERLIAYVKANGLEDMLFVERNIDNILVKVSSGILFKSASAELLPDAIPILDELEQMFVDALGSLSEIQIEGHTDNRPISNTKYEDNWDLSSKRASNCLRYLVEKARLPSEYFVVGGYGEYSPVATNDTEEGRQKNRRVQFVLKKKIITLADIS